MIFFVLRALLRRIAHDAITCTRATRDTLARSVDRLFLELEITSQDLLVILACQDGTQPSHIRRDL